MATSSTEASKKETNSTDIPSIDIENEYGEIEEIGKGGFAHVFKYRHKETKEEVAVKVFHKYLTEGEKEKRYHEEIKAMFSTNHKNLLKSIGIGTVGDSCAIVMTLCNCSLGDFLEDANKKFSFAEIIFILNQVAKGIQHLHSKNIIHRDIKPPNVLLKWDEKNTDQNIQEMEIFLADFGFCRTIEGSMTLSVVGTIGYMAPEILRKPLWKKRNKTSQQHETRYGCRADIYSFGATAAALLEKLQSSDELVQALEGVIDKCMEEDKNKRPTIQDVVHDLEAIERGDLINLSIQTRLNYAVRKEKLENLRQQFQESDDFGETVDLDTCTKLAKGFIGIKCFREACPFAQKVVDLLSESNGPHHIDTLKAKHDLSLCLQEENNLQEAHDLQREVLSELQGLFGEEDLMILDVKSSLGVTLRKLNDIDEAISIQTEVLDVAKKHHGDDHLCTLSAKQNLAYSFSCEKRHEEARDLQREVLTKRISIQGEDHEDTLEVKLNLAYSLRKLRKSLEANQLQKEVLEKRKDILGEDHAATLHAKEDYSLTLADLHRFPDAVDLMQEVVIKKREIFGPQDIETKKAEGNLRWIQSK